jgi:hypothetical protein
MPRLALSDRQDGPPVPRLTLASLALLLLVLSCARARTNNYGAAGAGLGGTVLGTGIYRAATGGCWANCTHGWYCERDSGLCVRGECDPTCRGDESCVQEAQGKFRCVAAINTVPLTRPAVSPRGTAGSAATVAPH